ncbi:MAG: hypothetical protein HRU02_03785 [Myxococcales bacterium]|nr:hypothetical protein [Myxococcales bacterium]
MLYREPEYIDLPDELREKLVAFREDHADDPVGDVAQRVLFEDDVVRIWEMKLEPGEYSDLHHHAHDYYLVIFSGDLVAGIPPKGEGVEPFAVRIPPEGNTIQIPKGGTEWAFNAGEKVYHEVLIELKKS